MSDIIEFESKGPKNLQIYGTGGEFLVSVSMADGKVTFGPTYQPNEAALVFWEVVGKTSRAAIIEECAQIAETHLADTDQYLEGNAIAAAIRALKEKL